MSSRPRRLCAAAAPDAVLITMGIDGALLVTSDGEWVAGPPPERGAYSVGSGDALIGGLVVALARGADLPEAVRYGSAAAAANALVPGQGELDPRMSTVSCLAASLTRR